MDYINQIDYSKVPTHVAIIMDGNGRWAKRQGKERVFGHREGAKSVKAVISAAVEIGVKYLTLYAFSTENWDRPQSEVNALFDLLMQALEQELDFLNEKDIRFRHIGLKDRLSRSVVGALKHVEKLTQSNSGLTLVVALNYSSRVEIIEAVKQIAQKVRFGELTISDINQEIFSEHLFTGGIPDPDLLIRTSGELRISNFLLWQLSYSELYFTEIYWPEFREQEFYKAIVDYQNRERRFGKISEQL